LAKKELFVERRNTAQGVWWPFTHELANDLQTKEKKGDLEILDLECFATPLRLRWLWFQWKHKERAWNELDLPRD